MSVVALAPASMFVEEPVPATGEELESLPLAVTVPTSVLALVLV